MGINELVQIGNQIRKYRLKKGLSQKAMAELTGIPYSTYSNYENNNREPNLEQLKKIAAVLEVPVEMLLSESNMMLQRLTYLQSEKMILEKNLRDANGKEKEILTMQLREIKHSIEILQREIKDYLKDTVYVEIEKPQTLAAHFDSDEYTEEELEKIKEYAAFIKSQRKN